MDASKINVCVLRIEGTNNEQEIFESFKRLGANPHFVHLNEFKGLEDFQCLMIPGGFSSGDYIRAGAIFASRIRSTFWDALVEFVKDGYPVGGICNGFQVLVELGLLPGFTRSLGSVNACLAQNDSARFECRHTLLRKTDSKKCAFTHLLPEGETLVVPSAHAEGKLMFSSEKVFERMEKNGQIIFKYCDHDGNTDAGYPWNPNGSPHNIAGICNEKGNVFGMMPHPERSFFKENANGYSGKIIFESVIKYIGDRF
ncbi:MAG TPA: phosphoribosylformylglycinamidine synthase subunit PurQ [Candidatus Methanofastidiosa archaeon]|nr:phosphoribosylformylglycinamidine synthase subunit PurQ [Candidatus Methanofastidiosa archaeon]